MKKLLAMLLGSAIAVTSVAGLAACGKKGGGKLRDDPRVADAYQAYDHTGASIGGYKTIAEAINATVKADAGDIDVSSPWNRTFEMDFVLRRKE